MQIIFKFVLGLFVAGSLGAFFGAAQTKATTSDRYLHNTVTGIAMHGYDLVSYFTQQQSQIGIAEHEVEWDGNYWHFVNAANADRFLDAPHAFLPQFNGYGAYGIASGRLTEGNPAIWALYENQLFFFHSVNARTKWAENPGNFVDGGQIEWERLRLKLVQ